MGLVSRGRCAPTGSERAKLSGARGFSNWTGKCVGDSSGRLEFDEDVVRVLDRG